MMKTTRKFHSGEQDCSCTSCLYKSASDNPSLGRFIEQGSRIDHLYYGKYIPLRERKLLDRLVRTRAVYDDIRAQLISDSTISFSTNVDSKPKNKLSKEMNDTEKGGGAIIELVDMVDKGATLGLSECCSCCICSSKGHFQGHRTKHHRSYVGSRREVLRKERLDVHRKNKGVRFKAKHVRSDPCTCTFKFSDLFKNNKKDLKKNMDLLDLQPITNERPMQKRVREVVRRSYENIKQSNKQIGEKVLEGIEKFKESKAYINIQERLNFDAQASAVKLKQTTNKLKPKNKTTPQKRVSKSNLQLNDLLNIRMLPENQVFGRPKESLLDIYKQKSKEKLMQAGDKLKSAMKSTMERKPKATKIKTKTSGTYLSPENDIALQIKKDSIRKFKEELRRKQIMKDWECDPECIKDTCVPEECYIKLKNKGKNMKHRGLEHHTRNHEKNTSIVVNQKNEKIQNKALTVQNKNTNEKRTVKKKDVTIVPKEKTDNSPKTKSRFRQGVRIKSSYSFEIEIFKKTPNKKSKESAIPKPSGINYKIPKKPSCYSLPKKTQVVIEHSSRDTQTEKRSLKRCFCTLKLKSKKSKNKHKKVYKVPTAEKSITTLAPSAAPCRHVDCSAKMCDAMLCEKLLVNKVSNAHTNTANKLKKKKYIKRRHLLPYECEPGVCSPGDFDPYQCIKLINIREAKFKKYLAHCACSRKTKSTSTFTSRSNKASKAKIAQSLYSYGTTTKKSNEVNPTMERKNVHNAYGRQAVQIGSTFSFNIEFYKNKSPQHYTQPSDLKSFVIKPKLEAVSKPKFKKRAYQGDVASIHKNIPTQMIKKKRDTAITTLKSQRKSHSKLKRKKMLSIGTKTIEEPLFNILTSTKGTKTKQKHMQSLKPYECEPFTCIPGECNPYECLERINRRNLRDVGVSSTINRSEINKGSSTSEKSLKAIKTQSKPRSRDQKVLTKTYKPKRQTQTFKEKVSYTSSAPSKQAVKIGSTYSFNIEFYKNKPPKQELKMNYETRPDVKLETRPITKNQGVKIVKLNVADFDTQVEKVKKHNKISVTKPLLKRCFCTLNLQKKKDNAKMSSVMRSQVYTVNTALMKQNRLSIFKTHCTQNISLSKSANININSSLRGQLSDCLKKSIYNECRRLNNDKHLKRQSYPCISDTNKSETIKSNFYTALNLVSQSYICNNLKLSGMRNLQLIKGINDGSQYSSHVNKEKKGIVCISNNLNGGTKHLTGLGQYLRGYFCTMNLQVVRNKYTEKQKNMYSDVGNQGSYRPRKLKPYECEPGVCVPGECDPYECLKLINKRDSNFSKKTGTESTVSSTSSYTSRPPKCKCNKVQSLSQKSSKAQVTRVNQDQHQLGNKKAVRVGSTFSFDIEFFKNSGSSEGFKNKKRMSKLSSVMKHAHTKRTHSYSTKTTGINKQNFRNRYSQSTFCKTLQKASATLPRMKRCFCTLKLQKKGRLQKKEQIQPSESFQTDPIIPQVTTTDKGQKAPKFKPLKIAPLEPYECPPDICVPGQCNPYECLEIMKKLNYCQTTDSGTNAITGDSKTSGSMTASAVKRKTRKVYVKPKVISKSNLSEIRQKRRVQPINLINPTKQAVRIGSNFSFNIEFNKTQSSLDYPTEYVSKKTPRSRQEYNKSDVRKRNIKIKQRSSETSTAMRHKHSQFKSTAQAASTMTTSFVKRCFCVLNLRKNRKTKNNEIKVAEIINKPVNVDKKTNTKRYKERVLQLEPYECEPGICIPGECDPFVCEKIIKRRNLRSKYSSTAYNTRSASSSSPSTGARHINTQCRPKKTTRETYEPVYKKTKVHDPNRQAVKIGSNFSFDIEFYKNKTSNRQDIEIPRHKEKDLLPSTNTIKVKRKKPKKSGTKIPSVSCRSQKSQIKVNKTDFAAGFNNVIKRCFCTLQLYNQRSRKDGKSKEKKKKPIQNEIYTKSEVHSKSVMTTEKYKINLDSLEPYECEPNICVPYECDPYECEKLIKLRQRQHLRETGMSTQHTDKQSSGSLTEHFKRSKKRTQSVSFKNKDIKQQVKRSQRIPKVKSFKRSQEGQSKQCVKIGSSFSFNIEFFKNKNAGGLQLDQRPQYRPPKLYIPKVDKVRKPKTKTQGLQSQKLVQTSPSQMGSVFMKTESTMARFTPPLKRCFCTLFLKRPKKELPPTPKPIMSNVSTETRLRGLKGLPVTKLLPYECEPNICIPGECNPLECLERINARLKHQKNCGTTTQPLQRNEFGGSMLPTKTRNRRSQLKSIGHVKHTTQQTQRSEVITHANSKANKQAVRIGSNFSFNIEFYKQSGLENLLEKLSEENKNKSVIKPLNQTNKNKQVNKKLHHNMEQHRGNQSQYIKQSSKSSTVEPFLKRCFCTLKLQKKPATTKDAPIKAASLKSASIKPASINPATEKPETKKQETTKPEITKSVKTKPATTKAASIKAASIKAASIKAASIKAASIKAASIKAASTKAASIKAASIKAASIKAASLKPASIKPASINPATEKPETKKQETTKPEITKSVKTKPATTKAASIKAALLKPASIKPASINPATEKPETTKPETTKPEITKSVKTKPATTKAASIKAASIKAASLKAASLKPASIKPASINTATEKPETKKQETTKPEITKSVKTKSATTKVTKTILKSDTNNMQTVSKPKKVSMDKRTFSKRYKNKMELDPYECEPNTCIPGECDPYECLKRIQARNLKNKTTQILRPIAKKSEGINMADMYSKKMQANVISSLPSKSIANQSNVVEIPRFGNLFNKQAVKIGSNFSFNIEFYKEILPPTAETYSKVDKVQCYEETRPTKLKKHTDLVKKHTDSVNTSIQTKRHNKGVQGYGVKTESKALEVSNALKRCFCTLKLQKELNLNQSKPNIHNPQFPQVIEVRRVNVKNNNNQTLTEGKSVGTKTKSKYLNPKCNPQTCNAFKVLSPEEMKVILPYVPNKFNRTPSKTIKNRELINNKTNTKPRKTNFSNRGKRLTKKKSKNSIFTNHLLWEAINPSNVSSSKIKNFLCRFAHFFSHKCKPGKLYEQITYRKENECIEDNKKYMSNQNNITNYTNQNVNCYYQTGYDSQHPKMSLKRIIKQHIDNTVDSICSNKQNMVKKSGRQKYSEKTNKFQDNSRNETEDFLCVCDQCLEMNKRHSQPLKVHFQDTPLNKSVDQIDKHNKKVQKNKINTDKLNNEDIQKAAGDQKTLNQHQKKAKTAENKTNTTSDQVIKKTKFFQHQQRNNNNSASDKIKNSLKSLQSDEIDCKCLGAEPPLFEMHLDSDDYGILNKEEVIDKVTKLSKKSVKERPKNQLSYKQHGKSCRCRVCQCNNNKSGATFSFTPKKSKGKGKYGKPSKPPKPCVCGSKVCAKERASFVKGTKKPKLTNKTKSRRRRCYCGSPICDSETNKLLDNKGENITCICELERIKELEKANAKKYALENKNRIARLKKLDKEDRARKKTRRKANKQKQNMEIKINKKRAKYGKDSDLILVAESLIDVGKLGITACGDILRLIARTAIDPKHAYNNLKAMKQSPELIGKLLKSGIEGSELTSTYKRIRLRCLSLQGIKNIKSILERNAFTNYLLYMFHKDPSKRILKRRPRPREREREREQLDFNCSLYMSSLRKRPYLSVYNKYPWFYPHFLSLLNVWKQFMEIALFLLAVVVWSPCILCMEACRACMCCFFCTG